MCGGNCATLAAMRAGGRVEAVHCMPVCGQSLTTLQPSHDSDRLVPAKNGRPEAGHIS